MIRVLLGTALLTMATALAGCVAGSGDDCPNTAGQALGVQQNCSTGGGGGGGTTTVLTPMVGNDVAETEEGQPVAIEEDANDTPGTGATTITSVTQPSNGVVVITDAVDGVVTYTPNVDFSGTDTFTYTYTDSNGASAVGIVTLTVTDLNPVNTTLQDLTQRATFDAVVAILGGLPNESALLPRSTDNRITIGPLSAPSFDFVIGIDPALGQIDLETANAFTGGFAGDDGRLNYWEINLDSQEIAHGSLANILIPEAWPHFPFLDDDPGTALDESDPANAAALSTHFARIGILIPGPLGSDLSYASYGIWEIEGQTDQGSTLFGGAFSFGVITATSATPTTGMATYNGVMNGIFLPDSAGVFTTRSYLSGTAALTANFGTGVVSADFTGITASDVFGTVPSAVNAPGAAGPFVDIHGDAMISGNGFSGTATTLATAGATVVPTGTLTGDMVGNFFGPAANEIGGVIRLGSPNGDQIIGGFAGGQ